jgi:hypothetical protein
MQLVLGNWANFQLQVSLATENQLHKTIVKWQISSSVRSSSNVILMVFDITNEHQNMTILL